MLTLFPSPSASEINFSFKNGDPSVYSDLFKIFNDTMPGLDAKNISGLGIQWLTQPSAVSNGTNAFNQAPNVTDNVIVDIVAAWNNKADDVWMDNYLTGLMDAQVAYLKSKNLHIPFTYYNYGGKKQDPIGSYGQNGSMKKQLQAVSRKYDPKGIFQTQVPGGFKLFK